MAAAEPDGTRRVEAGDDDASCFSCGAVLDEPLRLLGSLRCLDCRGLGSSLDPALVRREDATAG